MKWLKNKELAKGDELTKFMRWERAYSYEQGWLYIMHQKG